MEHFNTIIVCLDFSPMDATIIQYANAFSRMYKSETVYFINVIRNFQIPEEVLSDIPDLYEKVREERITKMKEGVKNALGKIKDDFSFEILQGNTSKQILKFSIEKEADLLIMGNKADGKSSGVAVQRIARRAACSLLILPEQSQAELQRILVPSDFSDYSQIAMNAALYISSKQKKPVDILVQNVFSVPTGYHFTGKSYEEFAEIMKQRASEAYGRFMESMDLLGQNVVAEYTLDEDEDPVEDIYLKAKDVKADMIVIGAKGRSATAAIFLGSMAERLIQADTEIPILVVRPKGRTEGLIDYLKEL
jgi:nucleotide-binding universal stress UspA family protein